MKLEILKGYSSVIIRLADGTLRKFQASLEFGNEVVLEEEDLTDYNLLEMGDITEEECRCRTAEKETVLRDARLDTRLMVAWKNYYDFGIKDGFAKPVKYPSFIQVFVDEIEWGKEPARIISHSGLTFHLENPNDTQ